MSLLIQNNKLIPSPYRLSFTTISLRPDLARITAEAYLAYGTWEGAREKVLLDNSLQSRSKSSLQRREQEIRKRLECLTKDQLVLIADGTSEERAAMSWVSVIKYAALVWEFTTDVLRSKMTDYDPVLRPSDYNNFISARLSSHPELCELAKSTRAKIQQVILLMLSEAGLLQKENRDLHITRPVLTQRVIDSIVADNPQLLAGFLWSDEEIIAIQKGK